MGMLKEFKEFAVKGNLVDIAVAFVMGAAFGKVVTSFTGGLVAPLVGMITGKDLSQNKLIIKEEVKDAAGKITQPEVALQWGAFLTNVIDFIIVAFVMFIIIKGINSLKKQEAPPAEPPTPEDILLLREIRDSLRK
ncbi:MAG TPA: large conductance mechanosensitive channel protein MscL [Chitinophagaceae bacterium]